jgi:UDP-glucose 4-epimerase
LNFLVTGGSGFIGRYLVKALANIKNSKIYIIDRKLIKFEQKNVFFLKADINNVNSLNKISTKIDYIYHLAADLGVEKIINQPVSSLINNTRITENIIFFSKKKKIKRLFFFSTSEVYSLLNKNGEMQETDDLVIQKLYHPRTSYFLSKVYGEFMTISSNVPYTIFRIFNIYGCNRQIKHVIPSIFHKLKTKKQPTLENPNHSRCFLFIDDAIFIFLQSLKPSFKNQIVNVANPTEEIKVKDLLVKIKKLLNNKKKIKFKYVNNLSITKRMPSIKKLKQLIKTKIKFTKLDEGLLILKKFYENKN